jgi:hypothetical protein
MARGELHRCMGVVFLGYWHACITKFSVLTLPYPASSLIYRLPRRMDEPCWLSFLRNWFCFHVAA